MAILATCAGADLSAFQGKLGKNSESRADVFAGLCFPQLRRRHEIVRRASAMFTDTPRRTFIVIAPSYMLNTIRARPSMIATAHKQWTVSVKPRSFAV